MTVRELAAALAALPAEYQELPVWFSGDPNEAEVEGIYGLGDWPAHKPVKEVWLGVAPTSAHDKSTVLHPKTAG